MVFLAHLPPKLKQSLQLFWISPAQHCIIKMGFLCILRWHHVIGAHHQLREEVDEVLRGEHHRGVQRNNEAGPQSQVQVRRQLLLEQTHKSGGNRRWQERSRGSVRERYPVEVVEDVGGVSRSEAWRRDADDCHAVRDLHLLLHLRQVVRLALSVSSGRHVAELHRAMIQPLEQHRKEKHITLSHQKTTEP